MAVSRIQRRRRGVAIVEGSRADDVTVTRRGTALEIEQTGSERRGLAWTIGALATGRWRGTVATDGEARDSGGVAVPTDEQEGRERNDGGG